MNAKYYTRLSAYIIDIMVLGLFLLMLGYFMVDDHNVAVLNQELNTINELALNGEISTSSYFYRFTEIMHDLDKERIMFHIMNAVLIIGYFVIIPYIMAGKTLGFYIVGVRLVEDDKEYLTLNSLLIRNMIINGLGYLLLSLAFVYVLSSTAYFIIVSILGLIQILLVIISAFMVIYRKDRRGLQDILSHTKIIVDKK